MDETNFPKFPSEACSCVTLKHISAKNCARLAKLNRRLVNLPRLTILSVAGCDSLIKPSSDVCNKGVDSVKSIQQFYLEQGDSGKVCTLL